MASKNQYFKLSILFLCLSLIIGTSTVLGADDNSTESLFNGLQEILDESIAGQLIVGLAVIIAVTSAYFVQNIIRNDILELINHD